MQCLEPGLGHGFLGRPLRIGAVAALLGFSAPFAYADAAGVQRVEIRDTVDTEYHRLAVDHELLDAVLQGRLADPRVAACPVVAASYRREGIDFDVSTLADWVGAASATLMPIVDAIRSHVFSAERIHADDTTVPVLAKGMSAISYPPKAT
jgi:hypothetical protein